MESWSARVSSSVRISAPQLVRDPNLPRVAVIGWCGLLALILIVFCVKTGTAGLLLHYNVFDFVVNKVKS